MAAVAAADAAELVAAAATRRQIPCHCCYQRRIFDVSVVAAATAAGRQHLNNGQEESFALHGG
jgi:hypothetical protein